MINKDHQTEKTAYIMVPFIGNPREKRREGAKLSGQKTDQLSPESGGEKKTLIRKGHTGTF